MNAKNELISVVAPPLPEGGGAVLLEWLVEEGEALREGEFLAQIIEGEGFHTVQAPCSGLLIEHWVDEGNAVSEGQHLATIETTTERSESDS